MNTAESQDALDSLPPIARQHAEAIAGFTGGRCGFVISTTIIVVCAIIQAAISCARWHEDSQKTPHDKLNAMIGWDARAAKRNLRHQVRIARPDLTRPDVEEAIEDCVNYAMKPEHADDFNALMKGNS